MGFLTAIGRHLGGAISGATDSRRILTELTTISSHIPDSHPNQVTEFERILRSHSGIDSMPGVNMRGDDIVFDDPGEITGVINRMEDVNNSITNGATNGRPRGRLSTPTGPDGQPWTDAQLTEAMRDLDNALNPGLPSGDSAGDQLLAAANRRGTGGPDTSVPDTGGPGSLVPDTGGPGSRVPDTGGPGPGDLGRRQDNGSSVPVNRRTTSDPASPGRKVNDPPSRPPNADPSPNSVVDETIDGWPSRMQEPAFRNTLMNRIDELKGKGDDLTPDELTELQWHRRNFLDTAPSVVERAGKLPSSSSRPDIDRIRTEMDGISRMRNDMINSYTDEITSHSGNPSRFTAGQIDNFMQEADHLAYDGMSSNQSYLDMIRRSPPDGFRRPIDTEGGRLSGARARANRNSREHRERAGLFKDQEDLASGLQRRLEGPPMRGSQSEIDLAGDAAARARRGRIGAIGGMAGFGVLGLGAGLTGVAATAASLAATIAAASGGLCLATMGRTACTAVLLYETCDAEQEFSALRGVVQAVSPEADAACGDIVNMARCSSRFIPGWLKELYNAVLAEIPGYTEVSGLFGEDDDSEPQEDVEPKEGYYVFISIIIICYMVLFIIASIPNLSFYSSIIYAIIGFVVGLLLVLLLDKTFIYVYNNNNSDSSSSPNKQDKCYKSSDDTICSDSGGLCDILYPSEECNTAMADSSLNLNYFGHDDSNGDWEYLWPSMIYKSPKIIYNKDQVDEIIGKNDSCYNMAVNILYIISYIIGGICCLLFLYNILFRSGAVSVGTGRVSRAADLARSRTVGKEKLAGVTDWGKEMFKDVSLNLSFSKQKGGGYNSQKIIGMFTKKLPYLLFIMLIVIHILNTNRKKLSEQKKIIEQYKNY